MIAPRWRRAALILSGLVPLAGLLARPMETTPLAYSLFVVHGSATGLAMVPVISQFDAPTRSRLWVRFPLVCVLMVGLAFVGGWLVGTLIPLPPKRSIVEHPLW